MNKVIALLILPVLFAFAGDPQERQKSPLPYYISYVKPDASVKKSQAKIEFTFFSDYYGGVQDSVVLSYNGKTQTVYCDSNATATLIVPPGKIKFQFWLNEHHTEIYTDSLEFKGGHITGLTVNFSNTEYIMEADKPVIYFYPQVTTDVSVQLNVNGQLGFTYPEYNKGWNFTADPGGTLHCNNKEYEYLFWDAKIPLAQTPDQSHPGFLVDRDSLTSFFEEKLTAMGLNYREQQDFITYWCPLMQKNEKSFVHFVFNEDYDQFATMKITPKPDHVFRVFMLWEDASTMNAAKIHPQEIQSVTREGFTVIEWGGAEVSTQDAVDGAQ